METQYDQYQRMLREQQKQTGMIFVQTALQATMAGSLSNIQAEMDVIRKQNLQGLAIQQEMMRREQLQGQLEEFIYNTQKIVTAFSAPHCDDPLASRYFTVKGIIDTVAQNGIATVIIRGRENKAAFEQALADAHRLSAALEQEPEVKEAIAWAKTEEKRIAETRRKNTAERQRITARIRELQASRGGVGALQKITKFLKWYSHRKGIGFFGWYSEKIRSKLPEGIVGIVIQVPLWVFSGWLWIPLWYCIWVAQRKAKDEQDERIFNEAVDKEITQLTEQLRRLGE